MQRLTTSAQLHRIVGIFFPPLLVAVVLVGCASGKQWVNQPLTPPSDRGGVRLVDDRPSPIVARDRPALAKTDESKSIGERTPGPPAENELTDAPGNRPVLSLEGKREIVDGPVDGKLLGRFRNTYYDFPSESDFAGAPTPLMNRSCQPIRQVPRGFYEAVCVQGSGTLATGSTVSFSRRDCPCALSCPRTGQRICFDELDRRKFPWGRGAMGKAITPLRSVAVDSDVIPLGTPVYILEFDGVPRKPGGVPHDGCFVAEDRGMKVQGEHVDVFTGNAHVTAHLEQVVPSNGGVHVYVGTARCQ